MSSHVGQAEQLSLMAEGITPMNMCNGVLTQAEKGGQSESGGKVSYSSWHERRDLLTQPKHNWHLGLWSIDRWSSAGEGNMSQPHHGETKNQLFEAFTLQKQTNSIKNWWIIFRFLFQWKVFFCSCDHRQIAASFTRSCFLWVKGKYSNRLSC